MPNSNPNAMPWFVNLRNRFPSSWRACGPDLAGGVTTAIVSLPMALAFGVASGAGPQAGLYGAVFVGLFASLFGGTTRLISEPTGPMTVVMTAVFTNMMAQNPEQGMALGFAVVLVAGLFQIALGLFRLGNIITLMPYSVISGFMSGIGIILVILQLPPLLGHDAPPGGIMPILQALPDLIPDTQMHELWLGLGSIAFLWAFPKAWRQKCPPQLVLLVAGTLLTLWIWDLDSIRRIGEIPMGLPALKLPVFTSEQFIRILLDGMILGTLGAIDTLLTAMIADSLTRDYHDSNRELIGQGLGNIASSLFGGLPGAGATMGTVVNIQTGAKSILAGVLRASLLFLVVVAAAPLAAYISMTQLAAIALTVGFNILDWSFLKRMHRVSRSNTLIMYGVLLLTVFVDLIVAVGVGVFVANILTIQHLTAIQSSKLKTISVPNDAIHLSKEDQSLLEKAKGKVLLFYLSGPMIFGVAKAIAREHAAMEDVQVLIIDLHDVPFLDVTVSIAIENMILDAVGTGASAIIVGAKDDTRVRLKRLGLFDQNRVIERATRHEAIESALEIVAKDLESSSSI